MAGLLAGSWSFINDFVDGVQDFFSSEQEEQREFESPPNLMDLTDFDGVAETLECTTENGCLPENFSLPPSLSDADGARREFGIIDRDPITIDEVCDIPQEVEVKEFSQEDAVRQIQEVLVGTGDLGQWKDDAYDKHVDGMFGDNTGNALKNTLEKIQKNGDIPITGEYDEATKKFMEDHFASRGIEINEAEILYAQLYRGLEAMKNNDIDGHSALDRVYDPSKYDCQTIDSNREYDIPNPDIKSAYVP